MPRFNIDWSPDSVEFFQLCYNASLLGNYDEVITFIRNLAAQNANAFGWAETFIGRLVNTYLRIALMFGNAEIYDELIEHYSNVPSNSVPALAIVELAFNCHGDTPFVQRLRSALYPSMVFSQNPPPNFQSCLINQYRNATEFLTKTYLNSMRVRLIKLFEAYDVNPRVDIETEITIFIRDYHAHFEIFNFHNNFFIAEAIRLQSSNILAALMRVPDINLETATYNGISANLRDVINENFPSANYLFSHRNDLVPFNETNISAHSSTPFSAVKIVSIVAQFESLHNSCIEQIRLIELYRAHPEVMIQLLPSILRERSTVVLIAVLPYINRYVNQSIQQQLQPLRTTWLRGFNISVFAFNQSNIEPLNAVEIKTATLALDYYLRLTTENKLELIINLLSDLYLQNEPIVSRLFEHILPRLQIYARAVDDSTLNDLVNRIPLVRQQSIQNTMIQHLIQSHNPQMLQQLLSMLNTDNVLTQTNVSIITASELPAVADVTTQTSSSSSSTSSQQPASSTPDPTAQELCLNLRELIQQAEKTSDDQSILNFLQTHINPEIYNHFPMPRHTIFVLLHYLMRHKNIEILKALLDIKDLAQQGIGPFDETIHQFFARYFGENKLYAWPEAITQVTTKIPAITATSNSEVDLKSRTLIQAAMLGDVELVKQCINKFGKVPAAVNFADLHTKETALIIAVKNKDIPVIKALTACKQCDANLKDKEGNTAYLLAAQMGREDLMDLLTLSLKVDITIRNGQNKNAAMLANENGFGDLAVKLVQLIEDFTEQEAKIEAERKLQIQLEEGAGSWHLRISKLGKLGEFPEKYFDPVSFEIMMNPIAFDDGTTLDKKTIEKQIAAGKKINPLNNMPFPANVLDRKPNLILQCEIEAKIKKFEKKYAVVENHDDDNESNTRPQTQIQQTA